MTQTTSTNAPAVADLYHREHEVIDHVITFTTWQRCQHGKPIVTVLAHWADSAPFVVTTGERNATQCFTRTLHADGSAPDVDPVHGWEVGEFPQISQCGACGGLGTQTSEQGAYGDTVTCSACGDSKWYSIGD